MNRRCFLSGAAAFAASRPWRLFAETGESQPMALDVAGATPDLRFGVVSDVHVREATGQYGTEALVKAFSWFRDNGADGLAHTITRSRRKSRKAARGGSPSRSACIPRRTSWLRNATAELFAASFQ